MSRSFSTEEIIREVTERIYMEDPSLMDQYGERGVEKCREDNEHHLRQLAAAYAIKDKKMFVDYALWLDGILQRHGMKTKHLTDNFLFLEEALGRYPDEQSACYQQYIRAAAEELRR
ncbi:MAG: hypothetical protein EA344_06245 [Alkalicoccus sp.]|nr:MAG: hypothetical protein EA344_06245 [Alkalicoccus sp.]